MKFFVVVLIFLSGILFGFSQNYELIDTKVSTYPDFNNINTLSIRIQNDFETDKDRVRAIYSWIAQNVDYDLEKSREPRKRISYFYTDEADLQKQLRRSEIQSIGQTMVLKKTLCRGFSLLFKELCTRLNIEAEVVKGITKIDPSEINELRTLKDHAWNVVKLDNIWQVVDVTWSTGYEDDETKKWVKTFNDFFFLLPADHFLTTHFPEDMKWQLVSNPIDLETFFKMPIFYPEYFNGKFRIANEFKGEFKLNDLQKKLYITFRDVNTENQLYYSTGNSNNLKELNLSPSGENTHVATVYYKSKNDGFLTIYSNRLPIIDFKVTN